MITDWIEEASKNENIQKKEVLSFNDYLNVLNEKPKQEVRPTFQYLLDMLNFFGKTEEGGYKLFSSEYHDSAPVFGQQEVQKSLVQNLNNFKEEGFNNKFILLVGPNGSSKSSLVRKMMKGAELYSKEDEGALYSFSWIFPIDSFIKGNLGLAASTSQTDLGSYAYLEDNHINAILGSELKDHPLLLVPKEYRQKMINEFFANDEEHLQNLKRSYLYHGDLSKRNRMIYDALLKNYHGKHQEVLKHIRVERFNISRRYSTAAVTIEPQLHVDARMQQITMDKRLASLPPSLQSLNLFSMQGEAVLANRGILEYSDLLKRPLDTFKYLLMTMETKSINIQGVLTELDIFFLGTSNEIHLAAFKQHPDFNSFKGRFNFIRVPYLLDYKKEEKIYHQQIKGIEDKTVFDPHTLTALCLFSVMTRLRNAQVKNYPDKKLANIVTNLNPLEKALFIAKEESPERLDVESKQILEHGRSELISEFEFENLYEGKFGLSPRDMKNIIYKVGNRHKVITIVEVIDYLQKLITKKNEFDFLNMTPQGDYHHPARFIALIKEYSLNKFDKELRDSLGMVDDRSYEDYLGKYIENVMAMIKGEKIKNEITGKYENYDEYFVKEFEGNINLKEEPEAFRSHLLSKLGAYSLDNPGQKIVYTEVFVDIVKRLKESFRKEQKKVISLVSRNMVFYEAEIHKKEKNGAQLSKEARDQISTIIKNLHEKYGHSESGALSLLKYIIKERY